MNGLESPKVSRRQRGDDSKPSTPLANILPTIHSPPVFKEKDEASCDRTSSNKSSMGLGGFISSKVKVYRSRFPILKKAHELLLRIPPRVRCIFIVFWIAWKVVLLVIIVSILVQHRGTDRNSGETKDLSISALWKAAHDSIWHAGSHPSPIHANATPKRVLYIVTAGSEDGHDLRGDAPTQDTFLHQTLPVMIDNLTSMKSEAALDVDLFFISSYPLTRERERMIRDKLPDGVGFQFWDDASPFHYKTPGASTLAEDRSVLARQHRFVVRDKLEYYDIFVAFEDNMLIRGHHIHHYMRLTEDIEGLLVSAPEAVAERTDSVDTFQTTKFFGDMSRKQLERILPGFIRVEVLEDKNREILEQPEKSMIPVDHEFADDQDHPRLVDIDPSLCCTVSQEMIHEGQPDTILPNDVLLWETKIQGFSLREFPPESQCLDWVALMSGPGKGLRPDKRVGGFWSGRKGDFHRKRKPPADDPSLLAPQGGWMATTTQLIRMNNDLCKANFLPPFDESNNEVENSGPAFWSDSFQLFSGGPRHCNMQRILSMNPDHFSRHLLYHVSGDPQSLRDPKHIVRANDLFGQLNHIRKIAEAEKTTLLLTDT